MSRRGNSAESFTQMSNILPFNGKQLGRSETGTPTGTVVGKITVGTAQGEAGWKHKAPKVSVIVSDNRG